MSDVPLVALQVARGQQGQAQQQHPFQLLNDLAQLEGHELDNKQKATAQRARRDIGQILATEPPETVYQKVMSHPGIAWIPDIGNMMTAREKAAQEISQIQQTMSFNATDHNAKITAQLALEPEPTRERYNQLVAATLANTRDPHVRRNLQESSSVLADAWGLPTADQWAGMSPEQREAARGRVHNKITGHVIATVGGWEGMNENLKGGQVNWDLGVPVQDPTAMRPSSVARPYMPRGNQLPPGAPNPFDPRAPAAAAAPANPLMPQAPAEQPPPSYAPGAVTTESVPPIPGTQVSPYASPPPGGGPPAAPAAAPAPAGPAPAAPPPRPTAAPPPNAVAPQADERGNPVWGPDASTHREVERGGDLVAMSDGKALTGGSLARPELQNPLRDKLDVPRWGEKQHRVDVAQKALDTLEEKSGDSRRTLALTSAVRSSLNQMQRRGGVMGPGPTAEQRTEVMRRVQEIANIFGWKLDPEDVKTEAAFTALAKSATQMGFAAMAANMGQGREPLGVVQNSMNMVPGIQNTFLGGQLVNRMIEMMMQRGLDELAFKKQWHAENNGNVVDADAAFNAKHSITAMENAVLSEFGLGKDGFGTGNQGRDRIVAARDRGYLTEGQAADLLAGRPARKEKF